MESIASELDWVQTAHEYHNLTIYEARLRANHTRTRLSCATNVHFVYGACSSTVYQTHTQDSYPGTLLQSTISNTVYVYATAAETTSTSRQRHD